MRLLAALLVALFAAVPALAQLRPEAAPRPAPQHGTLLLCPTEAQMRKVIRLVTGTNPTEAIEKVNSEKKFGPPDPPCGLAEVMFLPGEVVGSELTADGTAINIVEVVLVAVRISQDQVTALPDIKFYAATKAPERGT